MKTKAFLLICLLFLLSSFRPSSEIEQKPENIPDNRIKVSAIDGMEMIQIPAGEFIMGAEHKNSSAEKDEKPAHEVYLDAFWMDKTEVSNQMYTAFLNIAELKEADTGWLFDSANSAFYYQDGKWAVQTGMEDLPAVYVNWFGAEAYCNWAGRRLPSEAEWEKAARGTTDNLYPWGDLLDCEHANYAGCTGTALSVNSLESGANPYGVLGLAGNVWEWNADWYAADYYKRTTYANPSGPEWLYYQLQLKEPLGGAVIRGGSYVDNPAQLRTTNRAFNLKTATFPIIGFRCALSDKEFE